MKSEPAGFKQVKRVVFDAQSGACNTASVGARSVQLLHIQSHTGGFHLGRAAKVGKRSQRRSVGERLPAEDGWGLTPIVWPGRTRTYAAAADS